MNDKWLNRFNKNRRNKKKSVFKGFVSECSLIELYTNLVVYIPELGIIELHSWYEELPLQPKIWEALSSWGMEFEVDLARV